MTTKPVPLDDITHRLECRYAVGPMMPDGEPEFGWRDYGGSISTVLPMSIMMEAAQVIRAEREKVAQLERTTVPSADVANMIEAHDGLERTLKKEIAQLEASNRNLTERNALLRQRHDLPVDRTPAYQRLVQLQEEVEQLKAGKRL